MTKIHEAPIPSMALRILFNHAIQFNGRQSGHKPLPPVNISDKSSTTRSWSHDQIVLLFDRDPRPKGATILTCEIEYDRHTPSIPYVRVV